MKTLFKIGNWKIHTHDLWLWFLIIGTGYLSWWTNHQRVLYGFFSSDKWIYLDGLFYTIFSALVVGYVIANVINKGK